MSDPARGVLVEAAKKEHLSDQLLTVAQAVLESGFSEVTIRRHIAKGALPVVRRGPFRRIRIRRQDFDQYLSVS